MFEHYDMDGLNRDGDVYDAEGMKTAWFKDPDGNILSLIEGEAADAKGPPRGRPHLRDCPERLAQDRAQHLLDQAGSAGRPGRGSRRGNNSDRSESRLYCRRQSYGIWLYDQRLPIIVVPALADVVALARLPGRLAAVVLLGEARRAAIAPRAIVPQASIAAACWRCHAPYAVVVVGLPWPACSRWPSAGVRGGEGGDALPRSVHLVI